MEKPVKIISPKVLDKSMLISPDPKIRLKLEDIFHKLAEEKRKNVYGEREHAKFEGWFYRVEYDFWAKKTSEDSEDAELLSFENDISDFVFRHTLKPENEIIHDLHFGYSIKTPYFEEQMNFLHDFSKKLKLGITDSLIEYNPRGWLQGDEKKTYLHTSFSLTNFGEIYHFIKEHIENTIERH